MKLHYERVWDYDIDEQQILSLVNQIKITRFIDLSNIQLKHYSEQLALNFLTVQLKNVNVSCLPHQLIKPVIKLIYDRLQERKNNA